MGIANNCNVPEELLYSVREHVWVRKEDDGTVTIGMTDAAQHLAGIIVTATPKAVGKKVKKGRSTGTVESGKWVGPIKSPVNGVIVASNEAVVADPKLLNSDPYGEAWFIRVEPNDWEADSEGLVTGAEAVAEYQVFLREEGIDCSSST
ncbi:MAG: glycine cleavage system protein GcvH [Anaerolineales bacterium]|jgi:glycine cleavage system H protein|nr:glycine cleavage system protein GcvH [Anaerolineales bacterium]MDP7644323.1 glycine cleavage system protein GcvH [Anaerolineales bacterium]|tara:strand:- start:489 stop:935 length:447 start_codon:yes stop_codon:yes gene_type:complete